MTLEEFKKIRDEVFADIKKDNDADPYLCSVLLRGAVRLATAIESGLKGLESKARLWDALLPAIAKDIEFNSFACKVRFGKSRKSTEILADDFVLIERAVYEYIKKGNRDES